MTDNDKHILLILTGGTIGTCQEEDGKRRIVGTDPDGEPMLIRALRERRPECRLQVTTRVPYQVLSEHMTLSHMEKLAELLREEELSRYDAVFITHGSDTLAYTAAFLGELMRGCPVPVFLLAAQRPISDPESNGVENTLAALRMIERYGRRIPAEEADSEAAPVYIAYRNTDGHMYLHKGEELRQCEPGSDDFFSHGMQRIDWYREPDEEREELAVEAVQDWKVPAVTLRPDVLLLHPYVGIRYDCISLSGIRVVVHTLYHSSTAPKELTEFLDRCREEGVNCYILPCDPEDYHYETTAELLKHGAIPISGMSVESAYFRVLMGML